MEKSSQVRLATLSTGQQVPLLAAANFLSILKGHLEEPGQESLVHDLREVCLGHKLDPDRLNTLVRNNLANPNAEVVPLLKTLVLSAVRGQGRHLYLDSPFVLPADRTIAEFAQARSELEIQLPKGEFDALMLGDQIGDKLREVLGPVQLPPGLADAKAFAERCRKANVLPGEEGPRR